MKQLLLLTILVIAPLIAMGAAPAVYPTPQQTALKDTYTRVQTVELREVEQGPDGGYMLMVMPGRLVVQVRAGDADALYYAKQTLSQLLQGVPGAQEAHRDPFADMSLEQVAQLGPLPLGVVRDAPDLPYRGVVEGYYGIPWSTEMRKSIFDFMGRNKMNTYIYAPKDDPYHRGQGCYVPYPEQKAAEIRELVQYARRNHVHFVWAIHPDNTVRWREDGGRVQLQLLCAKLQSMYELGVRDFAVLVDDSGGEIGQIARQVELTNYLYENFIRKRPDVNQTLIMCSTCYNRSWSNAAQLRALGDGLAKDVAVMWTGDTVVNDIGLEGQKWVNELLKRPAFIWWNWPCTDYKRSRLAMGRTYGLDTHEEMRQQMSGFVANPMEQAEASKIGLFGVADYTWNTSAFDSYQNWNQAIARLYPQQQEAMRVFCAHNSWLQPNVHSYFREESVHVAPQAREFIKTLQHAAPDKTLAGELREEFARMAAAGSKLCALGQSAPLGAEILPWFEKFALTGQVGVQALSFLDVPDYGKLMPLLMEMSDGMSKMSEICRPEWDGEKVAQVKDVEVAMYLMTPVLTQVLQELSRRAEKNLLGDDVKTLRVPHVQASVHHTLSEAPRLRVRQDESTLKLNRIMEVFAMKPGETIELEFPLPMHPTWVEIDLSNEHLMQWARVELIPADGETLPLQLERTKGTNFRIETPSPQRAAKSLRLTNTSDAPQQIKMRTFAIGLPRQVSAHQSALLTDGNFATGVSCDKDGVDLLIPLPADAKEALIVGTAECSIEGAVTTAKLPYAQRFKLPEHAGMMRLLAPAQAGKHITEIIIIP